MSQELLQVDLGRKALFELVRLTRCPLWHLEVTESHFYSFALLQRLNE